MKKFKGLLVFVLVFISAIMVSKTKCYAEEVQYTDNVIPTMTNNTSPNGIASASSYYTQGGNFYPYYAFDHKAPNVYAWASENGVPSGWLAYEFKEAKCITKYTITSRKPFNSTSELPKDWTFEAWDEQLKDWVVLDTQSNVMDWALGVKKEFAFQNTKLYYKYRINITANGNSKISVVIGELEMMESVSAPSNIMATAGNTNVKLKWNSVINAQNYKVKRSLTPGGPYDYETVIPVTNSVSGSAVTYTDNDLQNDKTYYYVVSAVVSGKESPNSKEVSATPTAGNTWITGDRAILVVTMTNGTDKEYDLSASEIDAFINWYDAKSAGTGKSYFAVPKYSNVKPFISRKEFLNYYKIDSFEVKDYKA